MAISFKRKGIIVGLAAAAAAPLALGLASTAHAEDSNFCKAAKAQLDSIGNGGIKDGSLGTGIQYLVAYAAAEAAKCEFIHSIGDPKHADPTKGGIFSLQMKDPDSMNPPFASLVNGRLVSSTSNSTSLRAINAGSDAGRGDEYYLTVDSGPSAGQCLNRVTKGQTVTFSRLQYPEDQLKTLQAVYGPDFGWETVTDAVGENGIGTAACDKDSDRWIFPDLHKGALVNIAKDGRSKGMLTIPGATAGRNLELRDAMVDPPKGSSFNFRPW
jgi:hypothetical protein